MAEQVCLAPDGTPQWTFGFRPNIYGLTSIMLIACTPLITILLGPRLFFFVGRRFGSHLRNKTALRRAQILTQTESDEMAYLIPESTRRNSDDWEAVDAYATGTAKNGEKADPEWDGIVGFLHPFWYAFGSMW